jgi:hypothetical protein
LGKNVFLVQTLRIEKRFGEFVFRVIILFDKYRFSLSFCIPPREWAVGCVAYINTISKLTGSYKEELPNKILSLYK